MSNLAFIDLDGVIAKIDARLAVASLARIAYYESVKGTWDEVLETPEKISQQAEDIYWQTVFNPEYVPLDELIEDVDEALLDIQQLGYKLIILTSRMEWMREATLTWLIQHTVFDSDDLLIMKHPAEKRTPTPNWKTGMLHSLALAFGAERVLYIDDERKNWDMMAAHSGVRNGAYSLCWYPSLKEAVAGLEEDAIQIEKEMQESRNNLRDTEGSTEYLNTLSGHNQALAAERVQEAYAPSDAEIQAEAERLAEQTEDDVLVSRHELGSDEQMQAEIQVEWDRRIAAPEIDVFAEGHRPDLYSNEEMYAEAELQAEQAAAEIAYRRNVLHEDTHDSIIISIDEVPHSLE